MATKDRKGYVIDFWVDLLQQPSTGGGVFFVVTIADDLNGANADTYRLARNMFSDPVDREPTTGNWWALPFASLVTTVIATLKDALLHGRPVTVTYFDVPPNNPFPNVVPNRIQAVRLHRA